MTLSPRTFSLKLVFGVVTILAVSMAIWRLGGPIETNDGWGIVFAVIATPALVRASMLARKREAAGMATTWADQLRLFATSALVMIVVSLASSIAFCAVCFPVGFVSFGINMEESAIFWAGVVGGVG